MSQASCSAKGPALPRTSSLKARDCSARGATAIAPSSAAGSRCPIREAAPTYTTRITDTEAKCPFGGNQSFSTKETDYQPWKGGSFDLQTGLEPLGDTEDLFEIDEHYLEEMEEKRQLLQRMRSEVFASTPEAHAANQEALDHLAGLLPKRYPDRFRRRESLIENIATGETFEVENPDMDPLEVCALLVQEDFALLLPDIKSKQYKLVSAAVTFPMRWSLPQKMNRRMNVIHGPVPFYQTNLRHPVDEFMNNLEEHPYWRANYGITDDPSLFQALTEKQIFQAKKGQLPTVAEQPLTLEECPDKLFVRCERQTLAKLPTSGAVQFTIRTYVRPLREYLGKSPDTLKRLRHAIAEMPDIWVNYKTMTGCKDVTLELLDKHLADQA